MIITESFARRDLRLVDEDGVDCFLNSTIFENLELMGKLKRKVTEVPQSSEATEYVADKAVYKELDDRLVRAAITTSSLEAEHDSGNINKTQSKATPNEVSSSGTTLGGGPRGNTLQSDEDSLKLNELMEFCTNLQSRVLALEKINTTQALEITSLKRKVKKLEKKQRSRTHKLKRLYKVGLTARVDSSKDELNLGEDASKQRRIKAIDIDEDITLVNDQDAKMFDVTDLHGEKVLVEKDVDKEVNAAGEINAASNATIDSVATTIIEEVTLAKTLVELKASKLKKSHDKGKGIMVEELVKPKNKEQIRLDKEAALKLQAEFKEEQRLARESSSKRAGEELKQGSLKKQKVDDNKETTELKELMKIIPDEEDVAIDAIPLAVKSLKIVDWKIHKEGKKSYYQIIRANGNSKM
nr:hypothetical protein [Tanacetum cinerariifolium]